MDYKRKTFKILLIRLTIDKMENDRYMANLQLILGAKGTRGLTFSIVRSKRSWKERRSLILTSERLYIEQKKKKMHNVSSPIHQNHSLFLNDKPK